MSFYACKNSLQSESVEFIDIDFDKIQQIDISKGTLIQLETTDESLLYSIDRLVLADNKILIQSRKKIVAFDEFGQYLLNIGAVGKGGNEYLSVNSFFKQKNHSYVYDWSSRKVLEYGFDGTFLQSQDIDVSNSADNLLPLNILPLLSGGYIAQNTYRGEQVATPEFSFLNDKLEHTYNFNGLDKVNGATRTDFLVGSNNTLIYNRFFADTLYRISPQIQDIEGAYYVDFGKFKLTEAAKRGKDYVDIIQESNTPEFINNIATLIRYCYETPEKLKFMFVFRRGVHYVEYDKTSKIAKVYRLTDSTNNFKTELFISYQDDAVYISASKIGDVASNPVLIKLDNELFK